MSSSLPVHVMLLSTGRLLHQRCSFCPCKRSSSARRTHPGPTQAGRRKAPGCAPQQCHTRTNESKSCARRKGVHYHYLPHTCSTTLQDAVSSQELPDAGRSASGALFAPWARLTELAQAHPPTCVDVELGGVGIRRGQGHVQHTPHISARGGLLPVIN